jgi:hypothetical protein
MDHPTISLRAAVVAAAGLNEAYVLAIIERLSETGPVIHNSGRRWINLPVKRLADEMLPLGEIVAYRALKSLCGAGILDSCRCAALGTPKGQGHLQMAYSVDPMQLMVLEEAYAAPAI